jgi:hypothetical protein
MLRHEVAIDVILFERPTRSTHSPTAIQPVILAPVLHHADQVQNLEARI